MVSVLDDKLIGKELEMLLRNADILSVTSRGVATTTDSVTLSAATTHLINKTNVKNVRSITGLTFGTDYTYDLDYNDSGTIKCKITFTVAQTGDYDIQYDYGSTDKIFYGLPRQEQMLEDYPIIKIDFTSVSTEQAAANGQVFESNYLITLYVYHKTVDDLNDTVKNIRTFTLSNQTTSYYLRYIIPNSSGPIMYSPDKNEKLVFRTVELTAPLNEETI